MVIDIIYKSHKGNRRIKKETNKALGIKNSYRNLVQYDGMLISYYDEGIRINTLVKQTLDWSFLNIILDAVFPNAAVGIYGFAGDRTCIDPKSTRVFWI